MRFTLRLFGLSAAVGGVLGPVLYVALGGTKTDDMPLWMSLPQVAVMGALGGVLVAAFASVFDKLVALTTRR